AEQQRQCVVSAAEQIIAERGDRYSPSRIRVRILLRLVSSDGVDLSPRLLDRYPRLDPGDRTIIVVATPPPPDELTLHPEIDARRELKFGGHHADDHADCLHHISWKPQLDLLSDHPGIAAESPLPHTIADDYSGAGRFAVSGRKLSAEQRLRAERLKEIGC